VLQIFQTRYQIARLYTLRSLGMAGEMDVSNSDSTQIHWSESMKLLLPLIVFGQILQMRQAVSLLLIYATSPHELQILLLGLLFLVLFIGNAITTAVVMFEKRKSVPASTPPRTFLPQPPIAVPHASSTLALPPSGLRVRSDVGRLPPNEPPASVADMAPAAAATPAPARASAAAAATAAAAAAAAAPAQPTGLPPASPTPARQKTQ
jgi:hypothetical protein